MTSGGAMRRDEWRSNVTTEWLCRCCATIQATREGCTMRQSPTTSTLGSYLSLACSDAVHSHLLCRCRLGFLLVGTLLLVGEDNPVGRAVCPGNLEALTEGDVRGQGLGSTRLRRCLDGVLLCSLGAAFKGRLEGVKGVK